MTQAPVSPATIASYTADDIKRQLVAGRTVQQISDRTGWPRQRVIAIINGVRGWMHDPHRDTAYQPDNPGMAAQLPDGVDPGPARPAIESTPPTPPAPSIELKQPTTLLALIARVLGVLSSFDDPTVAKEIGRANTALTQLEDALTIGERRRQAEADLAAAEELVAQAKARIKLLKSGRIPAAAAPMRAADEPIPREIRAWAAEHGIECGPNGKIPGSVRQQYDAAHMNGTQ